MTIQRVDDIAPLLAAAQASPDGFRQGTVIAWNQENGQNTVDVGGALLNDLPVVTLTDVSLIEVGDVVVLIRFQSTFFILGRVQPAAPPDQSRQTFNFDNQSNAESNVAFTTTPTNFATTVLTIPEWADSALVRVAVNCQGVKPGTAADYVLIAPECHGSIAQGLYFPAVGGASSFAAGCVFGSFTFTNLQGSGITSLACHGQISTFLTTWTAAANQGVIVHADATFVRLN